MPRAATPPPRRPASPRRRAASGSSSTANAPDSVTTGTDRSTDDVELTVIESTGPTTGLMELPSIASTLSGQRILITGATGFLGTALVERLLRCVPDCELVVLVRPTRRHSAK